MSSSPFQDSSGTHRNPNNPMLIPIKCELIDGTVQIERSLAAKIPKTSALYNLIFPPFGVEMQEPVPIGSSSAPISVAMFQKILKCIDTQPVSAGQPALSIREAIDFLGIDENLDMRYSILAEEAARIRTQQQQEMTNVFREFSLRIANTILKEGPVTSFATSGHTVAIYCDQKGIICVDFYLKSVVTSDPDWSLWLGLMIKNEKVRSALFGCLTTSLSIIWPDAVFALEFDPCVRSTPSMQEKGMDYYAWKITVKIN